MAFRLLAEHESRSGVVVNGDAACTECGSMTNAGLEFHRDDGRWKVTHLSADPQRTASLLSFYTSMADLMDSVRDKTVSGRFDNLDSAAGELNNGMKQLKFVRIWEPRASVPLLQPAADPPPGLRNGKELFALLGSSFASPGVMSAIEGFPGLPRMHNANDLIFVNSYETGLSISFIAQKATIGAIHLYAEGSDGFHQYRGSLPAGLTFSMTRGEVEAKLGRPNVVGAYSGSYPRLGLWITYAWHDPKDDANPASPIEHLTLINPVPDALPPMPLPAGPRPWLTFRLENDEAGAERLADPIDPSGKSTIALSRHVLFDESGISQVVLDSPEWSLDKRWGAALELTPEAAKKMAEASAANIGRKLAIVLDGRVLIAAVIRGKMGSGVTIDLGPEAGEQEYRKLVNKLDTILYSLPTTQSTTQP